MLSNWYRATTIFWPILTRPRSAVAGQHRHLQAPPSSVCYEDDQHNIRDSSLPKPVWECLHQLRAAGHEVFVVGGAVRDLLLQSQEPKDFDLLTSAQLHKVRELFQHFKPRIIGRSFPICQLDVKGVKIEVSSMHTRPSTKPWSAAAASAGVPADMAEHLLGSNTAPGRGRRSGVLPHIVQQQQQPLSWAAARRADAAARDFTVNALLYDPFQRVLYDYVCGMADLAAKQLRCVGNPSARLQADPACLLRAVRCAARAGLQLEADTLSAIQRHAPLAASLNPQRLTAELMAMLSHGAAASSLLLMHQTQLLQQVLPLHHQHLQRQLQQDDNCKGMLAGRTGATEGCIRTHAGQDQAQSAQSHESNKAACGTVMPCQPSADSALAQMLHDLTAQQVQQLQPGQKQQHTRQQQAGKLPRPPELTAGSPGAGGDAAQATPMQQVVDQQQVLLMRVAAALDQHVGVKQPAAAEVVLACLTAPLVLETVQAAVAQLQQQGQHNTTCTKQKQQQQQQQRRLQHMSQQQQQIVSLVESSDDAVQQQSSNSESFWGRYVRGNSRYAVDNSSAVLQQQVPFAAAAAARGISTDSSMRHAGKCRKFAAGDLAPVVELLRKGVDFKEVVQQQALALATQVCSMSTGVAGNNSSQLFGVHTPALAASLLSAHVAMCVHMRQLRERQIGRRATGRQSHERVLLQREQTLADLQFRDEATLHQQHNSSKGHRQLSTINPASPHFERQPSDYEESYPRTNKQYRRLMERHRHGTFQQQYLAGDLGKIPSSKAILAAAAEAVYGVDWQTNGMEDTVPAISKRQQHSNLVPGMALSLTEHMVHGVLTAASAGFDTIEAVVAKMSLREAGAW